jgi:hypothetical protein
MHGDNSKSKAKNTTAKTFRKIGDSVTNKQSLDENVLHYVKNVIAMIPREDSHQSSKEKCLVPKFLKRRNLIARIGMQGCIALRPVECVRIV